jgi:CCR4-NOT complex subunit CAF16
MLGLLPTFQVLLMDEVTVDLDVLARADLLEWLRQDCVRRGCTVMYCTHIFDGLDGWASHLLYMSQGRVVKLDPAPAPPSQQPQHPQVRLHELVLAHLRRERASNPPPLTELKPAGPSFGSADGFRPGRMGAYR